MNEIQSIKHKNTTTKNEPRQIITQYRHRPGNGAGLFNGKDTGEVNKKEKYKQEKSKLQEAKGSK